MKKFKPLYQFRQDLFNSLSEKKGLVQELCHIKNSPFAEAALPALEELIHRIPKFEKLIYGHSFPMEEKDLGYCPSAFFLPESLFFEVRWVALQVLRKRKEIIKFISYRDQIEKLILLGQTTEALELLEDCKQKLGYSMWYYEMKLSVYGLMGDSERMIRLVSEVNKIHKEDKRGYVSLLLHFLYKRSMENISALDFDMELESIFKRNSKTYLKDRDNYFLFRLNFYCNSSIKELAPMLLFESTNSLIDRYILLIRIIKVCSIQSGLENYALTEVGSHLYKRLKDPDLLPLVALCKEKLPESYFDTAFVSVLDHYYVGEYEEVIRECKSYIAKNPSDFDFIKLYCHSLILAKKGFQNITTDADTPINKLAHLVYLIKNGDNIKENIYKFYQFSKRLYGFSICAELDYFHKRQQDINDTTNLHFMFKRTFDPYFAKMFDETDEQIEYLDEASHHILGSVVIKYQKHRIQNIINEDDGVVDCISSIDNARILHNNKEYEKSNALLDDICKEYKECVPVVQSAVNLCFSNFVETGDSMGAIRYYVGKYMENHAFVAKLMTKDFVYHLNRSKYKGLRYNLDFLIFAVMNIREESDLSFLLESYCRYLEVKPIQGLLKVFETFDQKKVEVFLAQIVQDDFLRHTTFVESTREVLDQMRAIIAYLVKMDTSHKEQYLKWQQALSEEMIAYEGMRKVDESKIYANQPAIIKYELADIRRLYEQYGTQNKLLEYGSLMVLVDQMKSHPDEQVRDVWSSGVHFTDNSLKEISYQLYDKIRYKFLKSKFGLGTYLSTRIRHGVFEGEVRSVFDESVLVLNMVNEKYVPITYWRNRCALSENENDYLMAELEKFSQKVDTCISSFKSDVLQIRIDEKDKGAFDYILSDDKICMDVLHSYLSSDSFETFCDMLMYTMWEVTAVNLTKIRAILQGEFITHLRTALDDLSPICDKISNTRFKTAFRHTLSDCRSRLERRIGAVTEWFHIQDAKFDDFNLANQLNIVWNITCKMHPSINCTMHCNCIEDLKIKGEYCIHISDLLRIFITNMMLHSKDEYKKEFNVNATVEDGVLTIIFENNCSGDAELLNEKFTQLLSSEDRLQKEGGSGLVKARKIVRYDLGCTDNEVSIKVNDGKCRSVITINLSNIRANG